MNRFILQVLEIVEFVCTINIAIKWQQKYLLVLQYKCCKCNYFKKISKIHNM